jgi:D-beta-D-heptose 7-phosphate kinase/D-beta-D-heptose 1-phosphate adenosyltransferase
MYREFQQTVEAVERGFAGRRVLVVGDVMLDRYLWGVVDRVSPEAPVPIVKLDHRTFAAGGAANVAANLRALGCAASLAGIVGDDDEGRQLLDLLRSEGIEIDAVLATAERPTISKTRIVGGRQQMLRLDVESTGDLSGELRATALARIEAEIPACSAIVLSDYGKGFLSKSVCAAVVDQARARSIPTFVDPKGLHYSKYAGCDVISPNRLELAAATSTDPADLELLLEKGRELRAEVDIRHLVLTLGELGIACIEPEGVTRFPAMAREVFDVTGAGDTVIATIAAAVAAGLHLHDSIRLANLAAGIVVGRVGTSPVSRDELLAGLVAGADSSHLEKSAYSTRW